MFHWLWRPRVRFPYGLGAPHPLEDTVPEEIKFAVSIDATGNFDAIQEAMSYWGAVFQAEPHSAVEDYGPTIELCSTSDFDIDDTHEAYGWPRWVQKVGGETQLVYDTGNRRADGSPVYFFEER